MPLIHARHGRILGRAVDTGRLITQRMNAMIRASLDLAMAKFESKSLDAVVELHHAICVTRLAHSYMAAEMPELDTFEACFHQTSDQVSSLCFSNLPRSPASSPLVSPCPISLTISHHLSPSLTISHHLSPPHL